MQMRSKEDQLKKGNQMIAMAAKLLQGASEAGDDDEPEKEEKAVGFRRQAIHP